jgi:DNA topoisomerase I
LKCPLLFFSDYHSEPALNRLVLSMAKAEAAVNEIADQSMNPFLNDVIQDEQDGLIHVNVNEPGLRRRKRGTGFVYLDEKGDRITDSDVINRIKSLTIPPMWQDVWISPWPNGYLQAAGMDARGRRQYLYHPEWTSYQQSFKFQKLKEFAYALPQIRAVVEKNLRKQGWPREKVLALIIGILDESYLRVGNKKYSLENESFGLTTLRRKHMAAEGRELVFQYKGKSNKYHTVRLQNPRLNKLIKGCSELRGYEVFKYIDDDGKIAPVDSRDVNEFLRDITGEKFTSKYFRTWGGTVLAVKYHAIALENKKQKPRIKMEREIVKLVSEQLNNTVSVCRTYYIHPAVLQVLDENFSPDIYDISHAPEALSPEEKVVLGIIENYDENFDISGDPEDKPASPSNG